MLTFPPKYDLQQLHADSVITLLVKGVGYFVLLVKRVGYFVLEVLRVGYIRYYEKIKSGEGILSLSKLSIAN